MYDQKNHVKYNFLYLSHICMSVGWDVKWCNEPRITPPWYAKDSMKSRSPGKLRKFKTDHFYLIVAVIWIKYCQYGLKHYPINQSIRYNVIPNDIRPFSGIRTESGENCFAGIIAWFCKVHVFEISIL